MKKPTTKVIDHGWNKLYKELTKKTKGSYTKVGVQLGTVRKPEGEDKGGQLMAEIYVALEYGTPNIPARSTLRAAYDGNRAQLNRIIAAEKEKILAGKSTTRRSLALIGLWMEQKVKAKIRSNVPPPNAPSTVARKQKKRPGLVKTLIDTGQLHQSIRHVEVIK